MLTDRCKRWNGGRESWRYADRKGRFQDRGYEVLPIADDTTAKRFILATHYSGSYPAALLRYGLYQNKRLVGVAVYSNPTNDRVLTSVLPDLAPARESMELGRFVLLDAVPGNAESWMIARCHEYLMAAGVAAIVSCSDPVARLMPDGRVISPGHVGIIYQATNALYTGTTWPRTLWVLPDGTVFSDKAKQKIRDQDQGHRYAEETLIRHGARPMLPGEDPKAWLREAKHGARVRTFRHPGNHQYVFLLARNERARQQIKVAKPCQSYPKTIHHRPLVATDHTIKD